MATIRLPTDFKEFLRLLSEHQVEYLLVGGVTVHVIGLEQLKSNKRAAGRLKDLSDLGSLP
jgi:hypothetical protein